MVLQEKIQQCDTHGTVKTTSERKNVQQIANNVRTKPGRKSITRHLKHHNLKGVKPKPSLQSNKNTYKTSKEQHFTVYSTESQQLYVLTL